MKDTKRESTYEIVCLGECARARHRYSVITMKRDKWGEREGEQMTSIMEERERESEREGHQIKSN